jgi:fructose-bisphosphate aldolase class I
MSELAATARAMVAKGKGILAADESSPTIKKRFDSIGVESTEANRRTYRENLFTTEGAEEFISGVILFDETIRQSAADGTPFPELLASKGILPGIKVDTGAKALAGAPGEKVTEGLDGLRDRIGEYRELGARFAKWRAVITIGDGIPSDTCIDANAHALARYAALCVEGGLVPIVEPEVLMDGPHSIERCCEVTERTLPTWCCRGPSARARPASRRSPRQPCVASAIAFPPPCRASCSCRAVRATSSPRRI